MGHLALLSFTLAVVVFLVACGRGSTDGIAQVASPSNEVATPAQTDWPETVSSTLVAPAGTMTVEPPCDDPYIEGAPYVPTPGTPIMLAPRGRSGPLEPYEFDLPTLDEPLLWIVRTVLGQEHDRFAVLIKNLDDGTGVMIEPNRQFYAASLYKVWVMLEAFNQDAAGALRWSEQYVVSDHYESWGLNPGELEECDVVTLDQALEAMMSRSDNVAANVMLDRVGAGNVNRTLRSLGLSQTGFLGEDGMPTTVYEMASLMEAIYEGAAVEGSVSERMMELLESELIDDRIPALLPEDVIVAHKTGNWEAATHDSGMVFSEDAIYIIVVLSDFGYAEDGATPIAELSRAVYEYYNPR